MLKILGLAAVLGLAVLTLPHCSQTYYSVWETFGKDKRDLLRDKVEAVRDQQKETKEQFEDALTRMRKAYGTGGGDLEKMYDTIKADYDQSAAQAKALSDRIARVEKVGNDLFAEWSEEIDEIKDARLKSDSRAKLASTKQRFETMRAAMHRSEKSMTPVLDKFHDQVLYLKHNLNAQAVGNLGGEVKNIERSLTELSKAMNRSIAESEAFIKSLPENSAPSV